MATIDIWADPWLPRKWTRRPVTPKGGALLNKVDELLDPYVGSWDVQLVQKMFWAEDAALILSIPVRADIDDGSMI